MSTTSSLGPLTPPLCSKIEHFGMWETDIDGHVDVIEEMRTTQRKINRWMEIWLSVEKQLGERATLLKNLNESKEQIKMLEALLRKMEGQHEDLKSQVVHQHTTLSTLQSSSEQQRQENEALERQLNSKNEVLGQLVKAAERVKRRNLLLDRLKHKLLALLKDSENPSTVRAKALNEVFRRYGIMSDLKNCRLVSKSWCQLATPILRQQTDQIYFENGAILDNFLGLMKSTFDEDSIPTIDYKLDESCLYVGNEKSIENFLNICGGSMQTLSLTCSESFVHTFTINMKNLDLFSQLKELFILVTNEDYRYTVKMNTTTSFHRLTQVNKPGDFIPALVKASPNIEKFTLIISPSKSMERKILSKFDKYGKLIQETFQNLGDKCTFVEVDAQMSDANLQILKSTRKMTTRKLKDFHLILQESTNLTTDGVREFLASQANSLENLKIIYDEPLGKLKFEFPQQQMTELKCLTLKGFHRKDAFTEPIEYGKCFPVLEKFSLTCANDETGNEWTTLFPTNIAPAVGVQEIMLTLSRFDTVSYHLIGRIFPAVKKLRLVVPFTVPEVQESLWCAMPTLEDLELHLNVNQSTCVDELFTGIPAEKCNRILEQRAFFDVGVDKIRKRASLTHLKALKRLKLNLRDHLITDVTGYLAFLQMKNLQCLDISWDSQFGMTSECLRVLKQRFNFYCRQR